MTLTFPNPSRSYDDAEIAVRFMGYTGMTSVPFLIEKTALELNGKIFPTEASLLAAFDASIHDIHKTARRVHSNARQTSYRITARDMK